MKSIAHLLTTAAQASVVYATTRLYVSDYSGSITSFSLSSQDGNYTLEEISINTDCAPNPSWLTLSPDQSQLFCMNEGLDTDDGSLSSFTITTDGSLQHIKTASTLNGPVNGAIYGPGGHHAIALAHYGGSAVSSWTLQSDGGFEFLENIDFDLSQHGPRPEQDAPHPHEAVVDPTGEYILMPDLGADLVRVFWFNATSLRIHEREPLTAPSGSGPRHIAFWVKDDKMYMYLVSELASTVTAYEVGYLSDRSGMAFSEIYRSSTFGTLEQPGGNAPAEIHISPDNRFLVISNRNDSSFQIDSSFDPTLQPGQTETSDSLSTFTLNDDGTLTFLQLAPAGGIFPRDFSINAAGDIVAVGLQYSDRLVLLKRNVTSGRIHEPVAVAPIGGNLTCVVWDE